jgi:DNA-binding winged helix-turn-helix (wHTH) protein
MDTRSRILLKDGATVRLTPKAFDTLYVLVQHASQVVDKEQLLKEVWPDIFVEEGSLSHNIHNLRKALGDDSSEPRYIETIPKRGYRFVAPVKISQAATEQVGFKGAEEDALAIEKLTSLTKRIFLAKFTKRNSLPNPHRCRGAQNPTR